MRKSSDFSQEEIKKQREEMTRQFQIAQEEELKKLKREQKSWYVQTKEKESERRYPNFFHTK
jgi:hypothetical protein